MVRHSKEEKKKVLEAILLILILGIIVILIALNYGKAPSVVSTRDVTVNNVSYNESQIQNMTLSEGDTLTVHWTIVVENPTLIGQLKCTIGMLAGIGSPLSQEMGWEYVTGIYPNDESAWLCNGVQ